MLNIKIHISYIFLLIYLQSINLYFCNRISEPLNVDEYSSITIDKFGLLEKHFIKYKQKTNITFNIGQQEKYQVNIHSINCNIKLTFNGEIINKINLDTYSLRMNFTSNKVILEPIIDIINGEEKENYDIKNCPLSINSINETKPEVKIENKIDSYFFFGKSTINLLTISYNIKEVSVYNFAALFFQFNEKNNFLINVNYKNETKQIDLVTKSIYNSSFIFLNSEILINALNNCTNGNLFIIIENKDNNVNKGVNMQFSLIEKDSISMLKKDALNYGFITSKNKYQYFYMEVFTGEEGELMLHNKRLYGELHAKIIHKNEINEEDLNNPEKYPNETENNLVYNPHSLQLKYNNQNTINCSDGCYILITYEQKLSKGNFPLIGYEFTILSRIWNYSDYNPQIIDLPFNEYIIGVFEKESITHHYYSISIPDDTDKIIIQIEGNYIDGFYDEGRKKVNTMKGNVGKLEIINNQNVLILNKNELKFQKKEISLAIRPKDYFTDIFSFYYFRIFYLKDNEKIYFPMDSNLGNLCRPEYDEEQNSFYCYSILTNNYNELSTNFTVSSSNQNEYFKIYVTKINNSNLINEPKEFIFLKNDGVNDAANYLFKYEFKNNEIRNLLSSFSDKIEEFFPQIYSPQMFYFYNFNKTTKFNVQNNYTLNYKYIHGITGWIDLSFLGNIQHFHSNKNFKGRPFSFPIDKNTTYIKYYLKVNGEIIFYFQLIYNRKNKAIEEIKSGETISQIMNNNYFPLYYYLECKNKSYANIDVNLRLSSYNETAMQNIFEIKGYMLDEDTIKRKINGEYIQPKEALFGNYSDKFRVGFLQVNQAIIKNQYFLLIEIINKDVSYITSYLLVDLATKEYSGEIYFMPINQYLIETFNDTNTTIRKENQYFINVNQRESSDIILEFSPNYNDIDLIFRDLNNSHYTLKYITGFKRYRIRNEPYNTIYFNVINNREKNANYMIRFFFSTQRLENNYYLARFHEPKINYLNNDYATVSLTFDSIKINVDDKPANRADIFFNINGILFKKDKSSDELINTTSILQERVPLYENKTQHKYSLDDPKEFNLIFANIPRKNNFIYDLQVLVNVIIQDNILNEEFLMYNFEVDLTGIKYEEDNSNILVIILPIIGAIVLILIIFFVVKYIRLMKGNVNLKEHLKSMAYSNEIKNNVIVEDQINSQKESDYETTFI